MRCSSPDIIEYIVLNPTIDCNLDGWQLELIYSTQHTQYVVCVPTIFLQRMPNGFVTRSTALVSDHSDVDKRRKQIFWINRQMDTFWSGRPSTLFATKGVDIERRYRALRFTQINHTTNNVVAKLTGYNIPWLFFVRIPVYFYNKYYIKIHRTTVPKSYP